MAEPTIQTVSIEAFRRAASEARFWREGAARMADEARKAAMYTGTNADQVRVAVLGRLSAGPPRPADGVLSAAYVGDAGLPLIGENQ